MLFFFFASRAMFSSVFKRESKGVLNAIKAGILA